MLSFLNFFDAVTSDERAESDPSDKTQQTLFDGFHRATSMIRRRICGEDISNDEILQTLMNSFGAFFSRDD